MSTDLEELYGLRDKVALLSGGAGGIAQGLARALSALKVRLAIMDINSEGLERVVCELESNGADVVAMPCDITRKEQVEAVVTSTVRRFGTVDFLINCAGLSHVQTSVEFDEGKWDQVMAVNLKGTFLNEMIGKPIIRGGQASWRMW